MATKRPTIAASETGDPLLLTPGPLTTSRTVKQAMVHDWGSRDATFIKINQIGADAAAGDRQRRRATSSPCRCRAPAPSRSRRCSRPSFRATARCCVLINGAYGQRAKKICEIAGRAVAVHETPEDTPPDLAAVETLLGGDKAITPCLRRPLRDHLRHPQSDRRDRAHWRSATAGACSSTR